MPVGKSIPESGWWINLVPKDLKITPQNVENSRRLLFNNKRREELQNANS